MMPIILIVVVSLVLGLALFLVARRSKERSELIGLLANIATIVAVVFALVAVVYGILQYNFAVQMARGDIEQFTAQKIEEVRAEVQKQKNELLDVSKKGEFFSEGNVFLSSEQYEEAAACFDKVLKLDPDNELAIRLLGWSSIMEAVEAGWKSDTGTKAIAATRAKEAYLRLSRMGADPDFAFDLARAYVLLGDKENCRKYLLLAEQAGKLPGKDHSVLYGLFDSVRGEDWFMDLKWRGPEER